MASHPRSVAQVPGAVSMAAMTQSKVGKPVPHRSPAPSSLKLTLIRKCMVQQGRRSLTVSPLHRRWRWSVRVLLKSRAPIAGSLRRAPQSASRRFASLNQPTEMDRLSCMTPGKNPRRTIGLGARQPPFLWPPSHLPGVRGSIHVPIGALLSRKSMEWRNDDTGGNRSAGKRALAGAEL